MPSNVISSMSLVCNAMNKKEPYGLISMYCRLFQNNKVVSCVRENVGYVHVIIMQFYHKINYILTCRPAKS